MQPKYLQATENQSHSNLWPCSEVLRTPTLPTTTEKTNASHIPTQGSNISFPHQEPKSYDSTNEATTNDTPAQEKNVHPQPNHLVWEQGLTSQAHLVLKGDSSINNKTQHIGVNNQGTEDHRVQELQAVIPPPTKCLNSKTCRYQPHPITSHAPILTPTSIDITIPHQFPSHAPILPPSLNDIKTEDNNFFLLPLSNQPSHLLTSSLPLPEKSELAKYIQTTSRAQSTSPVDPTPEPRHGESRDNAPEPSSILRHQQHKHIAELAEYDEHHAGDPYHRFLENLRDDYVANPLDDRVAAIVEARQGINPHLTLSNSQRQAISHVRRLPSTQPACPEPYFNINDVFPRLQAPTPRTSPISPLPQVDSQQQMAQRASETIAQVTQRLNGNRLSFPAIQGSISFRQPKKKRRYHSAQTGLSHQITRCLSSRLMPTMH